MITTPTRTQAETSLAEHFAKVESRLPGAPWMRAERRAAMKRFQSLGLPHRRLEAWKYTDIRARLSEAFPPCVANGDTVDVGRVTAALGAAYADLERIDVVLVNGALRLIELHPSDLSTIGEIGFLSKAMAGEGKGFVRDTLEAIAARADDAPIALNTSFATDGAVIRIPAGTKSRRPIHIVSIVDLETPATVATRSLIEVGAGSQVQIIESHIGLGAATRTVSNVTSLSVGHGAHVTHVLSLAGGARATYLNTWLTRLEEGATYGAFQLSRDTGLARNETHVTLAGADAKLDVSGAFLGRGSEHVDTTLVIDHVARGCESRELFKAVLDDRARGVFQGKVIVQQAAQKTDGKQMAKALMLSPDAEFDSKPELEIYADDVACGHGSTVAEIDPEMLFYCRSRGIPATEARALVIESFVGEALEKVTDEALRTVLVRQAGDWLAGGVRSERRREAPP